MRLPRLLNLGWLLPLILGTTVNSQRKGLSRMGWLLIGLAAVVIVVAIVIVVFYFMPAPPS